jgi:DNA-directed RNA polymerase subunit beta
LQSLALDIQVLDENDNEIDLKQNFDDENDYTRAISIGSDSDSMESETVVDRLDGYGVQDESGEYIEEEDDVIEVDDELDDNYGDGDIDDADYLDLDDDIDDEIE